VNGGFSSAPKFPRPVEVQLMLHHSKKMEESRKSDKANEGFQMVYFTLRCMARGGIHDHIGGGFHRYSVDEYWHGQSSTCFILMLCDQLMRNVLASVWETPCWEEGGRKKRSYSQQFLIP